MNYNNNVNSNNMKSECVSEIHNTTNRRIYDRNVPSQMLQQYIDVRPVMTKYSYLPIVDPRKEIGVRMNQYPTFNPHTVFNPGNTQSPWSGFASNINIESELRNQIYALQKCSQAVYVPTSNSDLYTYSFTPLKNSNGTPFDSSTKLPVTTSNDAPVERPILNLRGYKSDMSEGGNYNQHNLLFKQDNFDSFNPNPNPNVVGTYMFSNPTRAQVKDLQETQ